MVRVMFGRSIVSNDERVMIHNLDRALWDRAIQRGFRVSRSKNSLWRHGSQIASEDVRDIFEEGSDVNFEWKFISLMPPCDMGSPHHESQAQAFRARGKPMIPIGLNDLGHRVMESRDTGERFIIGDDGVMIGERSSQWMRHSAFFRKTDEDEHPWWSIALSRSVMNWQCASLDKFVWLCEKMIGSPVVINDLFFSLAWTRVLQMLSGCASLRMDAAMLFCDAKARGIYISAPLHETAMRAIENAGGIGIFVMNEMVLRNNDPLRFDVAARVHDFLDQGYRVAILGDGARRPIADRCEQIGCHLGAIILDDTERQHTGWIDEAGSLHEAGEKLKEMSGDWDILISGMNSVPLDHEIQRYHGMNEQDRRSIVVLIEDDLEGGARQRLAAQAEGLLDGSVSYLFLLNNKEDIHGF